MYLICLRIINFNYIWLYLIIFILLYLLSYKLLYITEGFSEFSMYQNVVISMERWLIFLLFIIHILFILFEIPFQELWSSYKLSDFSNYLGSFWFIRLNINNYYYIIKDVYRGKKIDELRMRIVDWKWFSQAHSENEYGLCFYENRFISNATCKKLNSYFVSVQYWLKIRWMIKFQIHKNFIE